MDVARTDGRRPHFQTRLREWLVRLLSTLAEGKISKGIAVFQRETCLSDETAGLSVDGSCKRASAFARLDRGLRRNRKLPHPY